MVELRGDRYFFAGRRGGIINVGGLKIHPEEVEAVINRHPGRAPVPRARPSQSHHRRHCGRRGGAGRSRRRRQDSGRDFARLPRQPEAVSRCPAMVRVVPQLELSAGGKLVASCVMCWSPAARAASAWPWPGNWWMTGIRVLALARKPSEELDAAIAAAPAGALHFVAVRSFATGGHSRSGARIESGPWSALRPGQQCRAGHRRPAVQHAQCRDRDADSASTRCRRSF